jgi:hypothetical protein
VPINNDNSPDGRDILVPINNDNSPDGRGLYSRIIDGNEVYQVRRRAVYFPKQTDVR